VYDSTIGETGVSGSDNSHFDQPHRLVVDSSDRLYVVDHANNRVQQCTESTGWSCTAFDSGLSYPHGITIDRSDNIFIADSDNSLIRKCTPAGSCTDFVTGIPGWIADVAVDSSGNVFASDWTYHVVREYNSIGTYLGIFTGTVDTPYLADTTRIYNPSGIAVASDGSIYLTERWGYRLLKLNAAGSQQWTVGEAGVYGADNAHFGDYWIGPEGGLALDSSGRVYVPDSGNHRVQIYNSNGTYNSFFGSYGTGNNEFDGPFGISINPTTGDIFVVDRWNHRVQVYDSRWTYKPTLRPPGVAGRDSTHFNSPGGGGC